MRRINRREFLRWAGGSFAAVTGARLLAACGRRPVPLASPAPQTATSTPPMPTEPPPAMAQPTDTRPPANYPDLVVARGGEPDALVRQALAAIGGIERFIKPGFDVLLKPNICVAYHTYEYAATTNPWVVAALVSLCREAGAKRVRVMDLPFGGTPQEAYARSGIKEQAEAAGGEMYVMPDIAYEWVEIPGAKSLREVSIFQGVSSADAVINVPIAKTHGLARLTLGMKNLMGLIQNREWIHRNMGQNLADLASLIRPELTVVDAVRVLTANGPTGGDLGDVRKLDTLIVSTDIVAADSYASTLFGMQPSDLSYIAAGEASGLGRSDLAALTVEEIAVGG